MVKARFKNNINDYKDFLNYTALIVNRKILMFIVFEAFGIISLFVAFGFGVYAFLPAGILFVLFGGLYIGMILYAVKKGKDRIMKNAKDFLKIENDYLFEAEKNTFTINTVRGKKTETQELSYSSIYKAIENKKFVLLYVNNKIAFMIQKIGIYEGSINELREILKKNLDKKQLKLKKNNKNA